MTGNLRKVCQTLKNAETRLNEIELGDAGFRKKRPGFDTIKFHLEEAMRHFLSWYVSCKFENCKSFGAVENGHPAVRNGHPAV